MAVSKIEHEPVSEGSVVPGAFSSDGYTHLRCSLQDPDNNEESCGNFSTERRQDSENASQKDSPTKHNFLAKILCCPPTYKVSDQIAIVKDAQDHPFCCFIPIKVTILIEENWRKELWAMENTFSLKRIKKLLLVMKHFLIAVKVPSA